jgi:cysteine sulfinate desulfinase/cysteine desulfurase-like protein
VDDDTAIVSIMYANNETGVIHPVEEIGAFLRERGVPFHVDGVQAAGKVPIDVKKINCDLFSISGHKFHAPKGVGALYVKRGTRMKPFMYGGHQERGRRPGTENVTGIVGIGKAAELAQKYLPKEAELARFAISLNMRSREISQRLAQRQQGRARAQHHQCRVRVYRRRGDTAVPERAGNCGIVGIGVFVRIA